MQYSPESLVAFVETAALGSFSAAARKLGKSQSTVSIAISNLEADIGCVLFDRSGRQPVLNQAGHAVLPRIKAILKANYELGALAARLSADVEPLLSVVTSDVYSALYQSDILNRFEEHFPETELQCGPAEDDYIIDLLQKGLAHLGIIAAHNTYPPDIAYVRLMQKSKIGVYVCVTHPLATAQKPCRDDLRKVRQLYLKNYASTTPAKEERGWSAPDYLILLDLATRGFGWAELPHVLVENFGKDKLVQLEIPGYPRKVEIDLVWSRSVPLGPAGQWFIQELVTLDDEEATVPRDDLKYT